MTSLIPIQMTSQIQKNGQPHHMDREKFFEWYNKLRVMSRKDFFQAEFCNEKKIWKKIIIETVPKERKLSICQICEMVIKITPRVIDEHRCGKKHKNNLMEKVFDFRLLNPSGSSSAAIPKSTDNFSPSLAEVQQMTDKLLKEMGNMNIIDLELIEYKCIDANWKKLFVKSVQGYSCTMCNTSLAFNLSGIRIHLNDKLHMEKIKLVKSLYHPNIAPVKDAIQTSFEKSSNENNFMLKNPCSKPQEKAKECEPKEYINPFSLESGSFQNMSALADQQNLKQKSNNDLVVVNKNKPNQKELSTKEVLLKKAKTTKIKLNDQQFRYVIPILDIEDTLQVEFYKNNQWKKLLHWEAKRFSCKLCSVQQIYTFLDVKEHIKGKNHSYNMSLVEKVFHPKLTIENKNKQIEKNRQIDSNSGTIKITINSTTARQTEEMSAQEKPLPKENEITKSDSKNAASDIGCDDNDVMIVDENPTETITLEDSPEREIIETTTNKDIVLNPAAVVSAVDANISNKPIYEQNKIIIPRRRPILHQEKDPEENTSDHVVRKDFDAALRANEISTSQIEERNMEPPSFSTKIFRNSTDDEYEGFIGVEYVVKIVKENSGLIRYECCLCEIELDGNGMQSHLKKTYHRIKYLERHFPTAFKNFKQYRGESAIIDPVVDKLSKAIEKYHGRDLPYECIENKFRENRQNIMSKVYSFRHASELSGPSFTNIIDKKTLEGIIKNKDIYRKELDKVTSTPIEQPIVSNRAAPTFTQLNRNQSNYPFMTESPKQLITPSPTTPRPTTLRSIAPRSTGFIQLVGAHEKNVRQDGFFPRPRFVPPNQFMHPQAPFIRGPTHIPQFYPQPEVPIITEQNYPQVMQPQYQRPVSTIIDDDENRRLAEKFIKNTQKSLRSRSPSYNSRVSRRSRSPIRRRSKSPIRRRRSPIRSPSRSPLRENDVWQAYRRKFDIEVKIIDLDYESYRKNPQSYPLYNEEWQSFWMKKIADPKLKGINHRSHDFTPEWTEFFPQRLEELYDNDIEDLKTRLRERFVLPMHNHDLGRKYEKYHLKHQQQEHESMKAPLPPIITMSSTSQSHYVVGDNEKTKPRSRSPLKRRLTKPSKAASDISLVEDETEYLPKKQTKKTVEKPQPDNDEEEVTVVSVLRVLTALEDILGSLGPKVIDLLVLTKTLSLKKNQSEEDILTLDNCVFLETCAEKLKGQIIAGVISDTKLRAVNKTIKDIVILVDRAKVIRAKKPQQPQKPKQQMKSPQISQTQQKRSVPSTSSTSKNVPSTSSTSKNVPSTSTTTSSSSYQSAGNESNQQGAQTSAKNQPAQQKTFQSTMTHTQKKELAQRLASLLMGMGKSDLSTETCEQLIEVYQAIDQKKQEVGQNDSGQKALSDNLINMITNLQQQQQQQQQQQNQYHQQYQQQHQQRFQQSTSGTNSRTDSDGNFSQLASFNTSLNLGSLYLGRNQEPNRGTNQGHSAGQTSSYSQSNPNFNPNLNPNFNLNPMTNQHLINAMHAMQTLNAQGITPQNNQSQSNRQHQITRENMNQQQNLEVFSSQSANLQRQGVGNSNERNTLFRSNQNNSYNPNNSNNRNNNPNNQLQNRNSMISYPNNNSRNNNRNYNPGNFNRQNQRRN